MQIESETAHVQEILLLSRVHRADRGCGQDCAKRKMGRGQESGYMVGVHVAVAGGSCVDGFLSSLQGRTG